MNHLPTRSFTRRHAQTPRKQSGAVAVIVALSLVGLIGFVGLALDLGKLFIAKTELQNSADACALAAARELTGANTNQLKLAEAAGIATGERHNVYFQNEQIKISSVTFSEALAGSYSPAFTGTEAIKKRYARCEASKSGIGNWFIQVLNLLPGVAIGDQTVAAAAVATLSPSQQTFSSCPLPVAVCESSLEDKEPGDWLGSLLDPGEGMTGDFLWAPFPNDQDNGTKDIKDILTGKEECNTPIDNQKVGDPGRKQGAFDAWNTRFGLYKGAYTASNAKPDLSGFAYTAKSWPSCEKAFASGDFSLQREKNAPFQDNQDKKNKSDFTGLKIPANPSDSLTHSKGTNRRLAIVPVVNCTEFESGNGSGNGKGGGNGKEKGNGNGHEATIQKWACVLMLHPLDSGAKSTDPAFTCPPEKGIKDSTMLLEFVGWANDPLSPCASNGVVGGTGSAGPLVPVLVR